MNKRRYIEHAAKLVDRLEKCKEFKLYIECFNKVNAELLEILNEHAHKCRNILHFRIGTDFTTDDFEDLGKFFKNDKMVILKNRSIRVKI